MTDNLMRKKIILLALGAAIFASCQNTLNTDVYKDFFQIPLSELREDSLTVDISVEYPKGSDDASLMLYSNILDCVFGSGWATDLVIDSVALYYRNSILDEYMGEYLPSAADTSVHMNMSWETRIEAHFLSDWNEYHRYEENIYEYRGGAHGIDGYVCHIFDTATGKRVEEHQFFKDGYEEPVSKLILAHLLSDILPPLKNDGFDVEELEQIFSEANGVWVNGVFLPSSTGVTWFFQPYEIAPYAFGIISVTVPWEELQEWVRI